MRATYGGVTAWEPEGRGMVLLGQILEVWGQMHAWGRGEWEKDGSLGQSRAWRKRSLALSGEEPVDRNLDTVG